MKRLSLALLAVFVLSSVLIPCTITVNAAANTASAWTKVYACSESVIALKADGTVWTWGRNDAGQIGDGTAGLHDFRATPTQVRGILNASDIAAGIGYNVVLKSDGTVWAWGIWGNAVEPGEYSSTPVQIAGFSDAKSVAAGDSSIAMLKKDGTVWMLARNPLLKSFDTDIDEDIDGQEASSGENEDLYESKIPFIVKNLSKVRALYGFAGEDTAAYAAIKEDGTVWVWGDDDPELRTDITDERSAENDYFIAKQAKGISNAVMVAAGQRHLLALKSDGTVWTWGWEFNYKTVDYDYSATPAPVPGLKNVAFLGADPEWVMFDSAIAVKTDGSVWRQNIDTGPDYIKNSFLTDIKAISAGNEFSIALKKDGTLWGMGKNDYGQLGSGKASITSKPEKLNTISNITSISASGKVTTAIKSDKTVWQWGTISHYLSSTPVFKAAHYQTPKPAVISGLTGVQQVSSGADMITFVKNDGSVLSLGNNSIGELGDGTRTHAVKPVSVKNLKNVISTYNNANYTIALKSDGTLVSWGDNQKGMLGDGTKINRTTPVTVKNLKNVVSVAVSSSHTLALKADGTVWSWGANGSGELGTGNQYSSLLPVQVRNLTEVKAIEASAGISAALKKDGSVWVWGYNVNEQLDHSGNSPQIFLEPVKLDNISNVKAIKVNVYHMLALKEDGTVWAWGSNEFCQLGDGTREGRPSPAQVPNLTDIIAIDGDQKHCLALKKDGTVWVWGDNSFGQLGNGAADFINPVKVIK